MSGFMSFIFSFYPLVSEGIAVGSFLFKREPFPVFPEAIASQVPFCRDRFSTLQG